MHGAYWIRGVRCPSHPSNRSSQWHTSIASADDFFGTSIIVVSIVPPNLWLNTEYCADSTRLMIRHSRDFSMNRSDSCRW